MFNLFKKDKSKANTFKFKESENTPCFICDHVLTKQRPILYAAHDNDGDWQFLCGADDHTEENGKMISLKQATELDSTINDLYQMPTGVGADRESIADKWKPFRL